MGTMRLETAPTVEEDHECAICGATGSFVLYDHDKVCRECGYVPSADDGDETEDDEWERWFEHRDEDYDGFRGEDRIKMVGGFASAYVFGEDFDTER